MKLVNEKVLLKLSVPVHIKNSMVRVARINQRTVSREGSLRLAHSLERFPSSFPPVGDVEMGNV